MGQKSHKQYVAVWGKLSVDDLVLLRALYERIHKGRSRTEAAAELGISGKQRLRIIAAIEKVLRTTNAEKHFFCESAESADGDRTPVGIFCAKIHPLLDQLQQVLDECRRGQEVVRIQASEWSILWLLPKVLANSEYLKKHPNVVLDIRRAPTDKPLAALETGQADLVVTLKVSIPINPRIFKECPLFAVERVLIYPKEHKFACNKDIQSIELDDLAEETVFVLSSDPLPGYSMEKELPKPINGGRRIYIDSTTHMYVYVQNRLGVALGFAHQFAPPHITSLVASKSLMEKIPKAEYCLYVPQKNRRRSAAVDALEEAIVTETPKIASTIL